jgi:biotin operon repressor
MAGMKKNARPGAATPGRADGKENACEAVCNPYEDGNTKGHSGQISNFLSTGQEHAIPLRDLVTLIGLDARTVRVMIQAERLAGMPILSDNQHGYYLPADDTERNRFVRSMQHRAREILRVARAVERSLNE